LFALDFTIFSPLADAVFKLTAALASSDRRCFAFLIVSSCFQQQLMPDLEFPNRMSKCRLLQKLKSCLPQTPIKRASAIAAYLKTKSPTIQIVEEKKIILFSFFISCAFLRFGFSLFPFP
jgi:hypothetical protein